MVFIAATFGLSFAFLAIAASGADLSIRLWVEFLNVVLGVAPWFAIVWLLLIYPSGRLQRMAERVTAALLVGFGVVATLAFAIDPTPMEETNFPAHWQSPQWVPSSGSSHTRWVFSL